MNFAIIMIGISTFTPRCETNFVYIINYDSDNVLCITISPYLREEAHEKRYYNIFYLVVTVEKTERINILCSTINLPRYLSLQSCR